VCSVSGEAVEVHTEVHRHERKLGEKEWRGEMDQKGLATLLVVKAVLQRGDREGGEGNAASPMLGELSGGDDSVEVTLAEL
jgi:hypothetical protein